MRRLTAVLGVGVTLVLAPTSGMCQPTIPNGATTATQQAIFKCIALVVGGGVIGQLLGGRNNKGAWLVGAGVGGGACAALLQLAHEEDQARIQAFERQAVAANAARRSAFQTKSGSQAVVATTVMPAPVTAGRASSSGFTNCRYSETTIQVNGQSADGGRQLWCRSSIGDWQPVSG